MTVGKFRKIINESWDAAYRFATKGMELDKEGNPIGGMLLEARTRLHDLLAVIDEMDISMTLKNKTTVGEKLDEELQTYVSDTLNVERRMPMTKLTPVQCRNCPTHPNNGGDGICHCTLGNQVSY